jgi:hypothetical protein
MTRITGLAVFPMAALMVALMVAWAGGAAAAQTAGDYGAVASTKSPYRMEYGTAFGQSRASDAIDAAIADCEMRAGMRGVCEKHIAFRNRCAAVALGDDHTGAAQQGVSPAAAERLAVAMCQADSARPCKIVKSFCSG